MLQVLTWIQENDSALKVEAKRRGKMTVEELVVWMLKDVLDVYQNETDEEIREEFSK